MTDMTNDKLTALLSQLPSGSTITRRQYSWAVEVPHREGYKSCGTTLENALSHAIEGDAALECAALSAQADISWFPSEAK
jgi:hypothetical protein